MSELNSKDVTPVWTDELSDLFPSGDAVGFDGADIVDSRSSGRERQIYKEIESRYIIHLLVNG